MCDESESEYHFIITEVFDSNGELIASSSSYVPGEFEPSAMTKKYWEWLDSHRDINQADTDRSRIS